MPQSQREDSRPVIPMLSVGAAILGVVGLLAATGIAMKGDLRTAYGMGGAAMLLLGFSIYDVIAAINSRIELDSDGVILGNGKIKIPFSDIIGLIPPPSNRGLGIVLHDKNVIWSPLTPPSVYDKILERMESFWSNVWTKRFETIGTVVYKTAYPYGHGPARQAILMLMASPFLWLIQPWMALVSLAGAVLILSALARQFWLVPQQVLITPREIMFQYKNRVSSYEWAGIEQAIVPDDPTETMHIEFDDGRILSVPYMRPFYHAMKGFLQENFKDKLTDEL